VELVLGILQTTFLITLLHISSGLGNIPKPLHFQYLVTIETGAATIKRDKSVGIGLVEVHAGPFCLLQSITPYLLGPLNGCGPPPFGRGEVLL